MPSNAGAGTLTSSYSIAEYKKMIGANKPKRGSKRPKIKGEKVQSEGEVILANALRALKIEFEQEFKFHPSRKWRADFHLTGKKISVSYTHLTLPTTPYV